MWGASMIPETLPTAADCHHHPAPLPFVHQYGCCQLCLTPLGDDGNPITDFSWPSIVRERFDRDPEIPRTMTYPVRLRLAREKLIARVMENCDTAPSSKAWLYQETLRGMQQYDDEEAVSRLWIFAGGTEGNLADLRI